MKNFFSFSDTGGKTQNDKFRLTFSTKSGSMLEHVDDKGDVDVIFDNFNLKGGGKRTASKEREKKRKDRAKKKESMSEEEKNEFRKTENQRRVELQKKKIRKYE